MTEDQREQRELTAKEQLVVDAYEQARPGLGAIAETNIRNPHTGWSEIIESTPEDQLTKTEEKTSSNSFMYRRLGG